MTPPRPSRDADDTGLAPVARRASLGASGFAFVGLTVFLAVGAVNSQNNLLFWVFGVAIGGVIVSGIVSGAGLMGLRLIAHEPGPAEADRETNLGYTLISRNRWLPVFAIELHEAAMPGPRRGACVARLGPGERAGAGLAWTPQRRGIVRFDRIIVQTRFPFGLMHKTLEFSAPREVLAEPARVALRAEVVRRGDRGGASGQVRRARRGSVGDYHGLREYAPGDARRVISWRASARRGSLLVVENAEPPGSSLWVWITAPAGSTPTDAVLLERAIAIGLACVRAGTHAGRDVGLWIPWAGVRLSPSRGVAHETRAADTLAKLDPAGEPMPDSPPRVAGSDGMLILPLSAPPAEYRDQPRLDPADPASWLGHGSPLPASLRDPSGSPA